ncbi:RICIN domain-containing protein [Streptomyces californicus]|uniref:RICIN domain-containing protein n=1 Tax=Streptomyces californicus TaxID=67351 RepID=UPI0037AD1A08
MRNKLSAIFVVIIAFLGLGFANANNAAALDGDNWSFWTNSTYLGGIKCATPQGNGTANGTVLTSYECTYSELQRFKHDSAGRIVHKVSGKCVTPQGDASGTNGAVLTLWTCGSSVAQKFVPSHSRTYTQYGGKCVTQKGDSWADGVWLTLWECASHYPDSQKWI